MCHLLSCIEPDMLEGASHTSSSLEKAITIWRSKLRVATKAQSPLPSKKRGRHPDLGCYREHPPPCQQLSSTIQWKQLPRPSHPCTRSQIPRAQPHGELCLTSHKYDEKATTRSAARGHHPSIRCCIATMLYHAGRSPPSPQP